MYKQILRPLLFLFNPETAHNITLRSLSFCSHIPLFRPLVRLTYKRDYQSLSKEVFGIKFPNPVGLAGGLDKNGEYYNELSDFGFGFVEIGSLTPEPQSGNPSPRLFRLIKDRAIINRMGINNKGVLNAIKTIKEKRPEVILAANIAKNTSSQEDQIGKDYDRAFSLLYDFVDMFVVNLSCPNVEGLTNLQDVSYLSDIVDRMLDKRITMDKYKPILLKISPDLSHEQIDDILDYAMLSGIDGIVAGNTTRSRTGLSAPKDKLDEIGNGGLSGAPLFERTLELVKYISSKTDGRLDIIGCGGVMSPEQASMLLEAGASLVEVYTGFIYEGPSIVKNILKHLDNQINNK